MLAFCIQKIKVELDVVGNQNCVLYKIQKRWQMVLNWIGRIDHFLGDVGKSDYKRGKYLVWIKKIGPGLNDAVFRKFDGTNFNDSACGRSYCCSLRIKGSEDCTSLVKLVQSSKISKFFIWMLHQ